MGKDFRRNREGSTETVNLGTYKHAVEDVLVIKLTHKDIPYPNSPVLYKAKQIGKIDEVFGSINDVFVSVKMMDPNQLNYKLGDIFEGYKDKFMFKERFLPREEVEKLKEKNDSRNSKKTVVHKKNFKSKFTNNGNKGNFNRGSNGGDRKGYKRGSSGGFNYDKNSKKFKKNFTSK